MMTMCNGKACSNKWKCGRYDQRAIQSHPTHNCILFTESEEYLRIFNAIPTLTKRAVSQAAAQPSLQWGASQLAAYTFRPSDGKGSCCSADSPSGHLCTFYGRFASLGAALGGSVDTLRGTHDALLGAPSYRLPFNIRPDCSVDVR